MVAPRHTKVAVITGAGSGIGLACAKKLSAAGIAIVGVGRTVEKLKELERVIDKPDQIATVAIDVTWEDAPQRIVQVALDHWGHIDFLINNAGVGSPKPLHEADDDNLDHFLNVMLRAPFRLSREALPHMPAGSAVINISSTFAVIGGLRGGAYSAAKAGLDGLTRHIACQYGASGIRANSVAPGVIYTEMTESRLKDESFRRMNVEMTPHTRLGRVEDVAGTVAFLCSDDGSFINGQTIVVDGGWTSTKYFSERGRTSVWT
ncbi:SDR family oxidoreductase [Kineobactrum salinum]|uniref:SDR family oxidoreductase n=2 Tax=Kineobactrum salinum TaxID=2708301 RepID=A0A6C0U8L5_9GAMM|nr:SDR family oxidoreductase [Kineobactrum salinum]